MSDPELLDENLSTPTRLRFIDPSFFLEGAIPELFFVFDSENECYHLFSESLGERKPILSLAKIGEVGQEETFRLVLPEKPVIYNNKRLMPMRQNLNKPIFTSDAFYQSLRYSFLEEVSAYGGIVIPLSQVLLSLVRQLSGSTGLFSSFKNYDLFTVLSEEDSTHPELQYIFDPVSKVIMYRSKKFFSIQTKNYCVFTGKRARMLEVGVKQSKYGMGVSRDRAIPEFSGFYDYTDLQIKIEEYVGNPFVDDNP